MFSKLGGGGREVGGNIFAESIVSIHPACGRSSQGNCLPSLERGGPVLPPSLLGGGHPSIEHTPHTPWRPEREREREKVREGYRTHKYTNLRKFAFPRRTHKLLGQDNIEVREGEYYYLSWQTTWSIPWLGGEFGGRGDLNARKFPGFLGDLCPSRGDFPGFCHL